MSSEVYHWCTSMITMATSMYSTVVVLQRVDCTNRQCNATQETTTSESCQKCKDLEKCYNFVVSITILWQERWSNQLMNWSTAVRVVFLGKSIHFHTSFMVYLTLNLGSYHPHLPEVPPPGTRIKTYLQ